MGQNFGGTLKSVLTPVSDDDPTQGVKLGRALVGGGLGAASKLGQQQQQPQGMPSPIQVAPQPQVNPDYFNPQNQQNPFNQQQISGARGQVKSPGYRFFGGGY